MSYLIGKKRVKFEFDTFVIPDISNGCVSKSVVTDSNGIRFWMICSGVDNKGDFNTMLRVMDVYLGDKDNVGWFFEEEMELNGHKWVKFSDVHVYMNDKCRDVDRLLKDGSGSFEAIFIGLYMI